MEMVGESGGPANPAKEPQWERIASGTSRLPVPGGWLYRVVRGNEGLAVTFVPDPYAGDPARLPR